MKMNLWWCLPAKIIILEMGRMQLPEQLNSLQKSNHPEQYLCVDSTEPKVTFSMEPRYPLSRTKDIFLK